MPYYAVQSGDLFRCVLADDVRSACVTALRQRMAEDVDMEGFQLGLIFQVAEFGTTSDQILYNLTEHVLSDSGEQVEFPSPGEQN